MPIILQTALPDEMDVEKQLPGVAPCAADDWLRVDEAYGAQMAYRAVLLAEKTAQVLWFAPQALPAGQEVLDAALAVLPALGFDVGTGEVRCPDGRQVRLDYDNPLGCLGHLVQQDICIMEKVGDEHVLTGAVLCFPANWRLSDKAGRPLRHIHIPVEEYDNNIARRVQRLFDGVRVDRPLWRSNRIPCGEAELFHPGRKDTSLPHRYLRAERQCILRLPRTNAVIFTIHTIMVDHSPTLRDQHP